jgi:serine/threonine protein kinase
MTSEERTDDDATIPQEDLELERAVDAFVTAREAGSPPDIDQYVERHPRIAERLRACLSGLAAADAAVRGLDQHLPSSVPRQLGDFRVVVEIGRGGMGEVYRAEQVSLNRPVALKVLPRNWGWTPTSRKRFHREAQAAGKLHHTNIVAVYAEGEQDGLCYYAMELIDGPSLDQVVDELRVSAGQSGGKPHDDAATRDLAVSTPRARGGDPALHNNALKTLLDSSGMSKSSRDRFETVTRWISSVADALHYAHEQGVIHRDVKPSNLMLGQDTRIRLTDFGLAQLADQPGMTMTGEMLGTPRYMSPEQVAAGRIKVDARTDVYSLGATLYELLTLQPPFPGTARDQIISQIISKDPNRPRRIDASIPADLETICLKAIEKDAGARYQTAGEFAADLRRYVDRYAISAKRTGPIGRLVKWAKRRPALAALSACLLLSAIGMGLLGWTARDQAQQMTKERRQNAVDHAILAVMSGDIEKAETAVVQAELHGAEPGWVRLLEGQMAFSRGDVAQAQRHFEQAIRLMPDSVAAHALLGRMYLYTGAWEDGFALKEKLESLSPRHLEDRLFLAYYQSIYEPVKTSATLDQVIAARDSSVARLIRAGGLANLAQFQGDIEAAERATADAEVAYAMLAGGNQLATAICIEAHNAAANAYAMAGDENNRQKHLTRSGELVAGIDEETAIDQLLCQAAFYWDRSGAPEKALEAWKIAAETGWTRCVKNYVCELYRAGKFEAALQACDLAGEKERNTNLEVLRPLVLAELGRNDEAIAELNRIAGPDTKPEIKIYLALIARIIGRDEWADDISRNLELASGSYLPKPIVAFNSGEMTATELLATCGDGFELADASFHIAHRQLAAGDVEAAARGFKLMEQRNQYYHHEYRWARAFLERINSDASWPASIELRSN